MRKAGINSSHIYQLQKLNRSQIYLLKYDFSKKKVGWDEDTSGESLGSWAWDLG